MVGTPLSDTVVGLPERLGGAKVGVMPPWSLVIEAHAPSASSSYFLYIRRYKLSTVHCGLLTNHHMPNYQIDK